MSHRQSEHLVNALYQRRARESDEPQEQPDLQVCPIPAEGGYPHHTTFVVCLNYQRFNEFCRQNELNPRAQRFKAISGPRDTYKLHGYLKFDVVFLTDCERMQHFEEVRSEILVRTCTPGYEGTTYFLET